MKIEVTEEDHMLLLLNKIIFVQVIFICTDISGLTSVSKLLFEKTLVLHD